MIAAFGPVQPWLVLRAAALMSDGVTASHEYAHLGPSGLPGGIRHHDGWGIVYRDLGGGLVCLRGGEPLGNALELVQLRFLNVTDLMVVHVRNASVPAQRGLAYAHPLEDQVKGAQAFFFHNGYVPGLCSAPGAADWDSRNLLHWLRDAFESDTRGTEIERRLEQLPADSTAANFILVEPKRLTVCNWFADRGVAPHYYTMHTCTIHQTTFVASDVVSDIAPANAWVPLGNHRVVEFAL